MDKILNSFKSCCGLMKQDQNNKDQQNQIVEEIQHVQQVKRLHKSPFLECENQFVEEENLNTSNNCKTNKNEESSIQYEKSESCMLELKNSQSVDDPYQHQSQELEFKSPNSQMTSKTEFQKIKKELKVIQQSKQQRSLQIPIMQVQENLLSDSPQKKNSMTPLNKKQKLREYTQKALKKSLRKYISSEVGKKQSNREKSIRSHSPDNQNQQGCQGEDNQYKNQNRKQSKNQTPKNKKTPYDKYQEIIQQQEREIKQKMEAAGMQEVGVRRVSYI